MAKIIGNTTATPYPRPDWMQDDESKADYIKNKPINLATTDYVDDKIKEYSGGSGDFSIGKSGDGDNAEIFNNYQFNKATGNFSHAEGYITEADGANSHAEGGHTYADGDNSHAEGFYTVSFGKSSHAEGAGTGNPEYQLLLTVFTDDRTKYTAQYDGPSKIHVGNLVHYSRTDVLREIIAVTEIEDGKYEITLNETISEEKTDNEWAGQPDICTLYPDGAFGKYSHSEGYATLTSGEGSHSEGQFTIAKGEASHAECLLTKAIGLASHAEGWGCEALGMCSHAEGNDSKANNDDSHAEGRDTIANGQRSHSEGFGTIASGTDQHVQGKYNLENTDIDDVKYAHIVGNGRNAQNRSNAHTLDWNGNAWFAGDVYVGEINRDVDVDFDGISSDYEGAKKLATEKYVDQKHREAIEAANGRARTFTIADMDELASIFGIGTSEILDKYESNVSTINYNGQDYNLKTGDVFLIVDTSVPDYWVSVDDDLIITLYKMETAKLDLTEYATINYVDDALGDIETVLDSIIAIQNTFIGGDA